MKSDLLLLVSGAPSMGVSRNTSSSNSSDPCTPKSCAIADPEKEEKLHITYLNIWMKLYK